MRRASTTRARRGRKIKADASARRAIGENMKESERERGASTDKVASRRCGSKSAAIGHTCAQPTVQSRARVAAATTPRIDPSRLSCAALYIYMYIQYSGTSTRSARRQRAKIICRFAASTNLYNISYLLPIYRASIIYVKRTIFH